MRRRSTVCGIGKYRIVHRGSVACEVDRSRSSAMDTAEIEHQLAVNVNPYIIVAAKLKLQGIRRTTRHRAVRRHVKINVCLYAEMIIRILCRFGSDVERVEALRFCHIVSGIRIAVRVHNQRCTVIALPAVNHAVAVGIRKMDIRAGIRICIVSIGAEGIIARLRIISIRDLNIIVDLLIPLSLRKQASFGNRKRDFAIGGQVRVRQTGGNSSIVIRTTNITGEYVFFRRKSLSRDDPVGFDLRNRHPILTGCAYGNFQLFDSIMYRSEVDRSHRDTHSA